MKESLSSIMSEIKSRVNTDDVTTQVDQEEIEVQKGKTVVVMPAGGKGTRIRAETNTEGINKVMISIDGNESMIEKAIREYSESGIDKFVILTGFLADVVEEHLGDGSRWDVDIKYSRDPDGRKVGNAGAILNSLNNGTLDPSLTAIVHNPDDVIISHERSYSEVFLEGHLKARKRGCIATFVVVPETPFQYSGMIIKDGYILDITKYPPITIPAHTGITVFDPEALSYFERYVSLEAETSFENVLAPIWAEEGRLFAINIPSDWWIPVNDLKGVEKAKTELLGQKNKP